MHTGVQTEIGLNGPEDGEGDPGEGDGHPEQPLQPVLAGGEDVADAVDRAVLCVLLDRAVQHHAVHWRSVGQTRAGWGNALLAIIVWQ